VVSHPRCFSAHTGSTPTHKATSRARPRYRKQWESKAHTMLWALVADETLCAGNHCRGVCGGNIANLPETLLVSYEGGSTCLTCSRKVKQNYIRQVDVPHDLLVSQTTRGQQRLWAVSFEGNWDVAPTSDQFLNGSCLAERRLTISATKRKEESVQKKQNASCKVTQLGCWLPRVVLPTWKCAPGFLSVSSASEVLSPQVLSPQVLSPQVLSAHPSSAVWYCPLR
jgi:hypothetical protein